MTTRAEQVLERVRQITEGEEEARQRAESEIVNKLELKKQKYQDEQKKIRDVFYGVGILIVCEDLLKRIHGSRMELSVTEKFVDFYKGGYHLGIYKMVFHLGPSFDHRVGGEFTIIFIPGHKENVHGSFLGISYVSGVVIPEKLIIDSPAMVQERIVGVDGGIDDLLARVLVACGRVVRGDDEQPTYGPFGLADR